MMDRELKKRIKKIFEEEKPPQREKIQFLNNLPASELSMGQFIMIQAGYLRRWVIVSTILSAVPVLLVANFMKQNILWMIFALIPLLAVLAVAENNRSIQYGMIEFEMSTRFSLKSVVLARMIVLGIMDFAMIFFFLLICKKEKDFSLFQTSCYLLVPYLLTATGSLWIVRHFPNKDAIYSCMVLAVLVSSLSSSLYFRADFLYEFSYIKWWVIVLIFLMIKAGYEIYYTIKQTEECIWSL